MYQELLSHRMNRDLADANRQRAQSVLPPATTLSWPVAIIFAFIGGLILNLMPCVLPVLSLKVLHLVEAAGDRQQAVRAAGAFTAGVVVSFWLLGGVLLILQLFLDGIGWGFQLQGSRRPQHQFVVEIGTSLKGGGAGSFLC